MTAAIDPAVNLLAELTRRGIEVQAHGDRLRFRPRDAMTPPLAERIKTHKPDLLALLAGAALLPCCPEWPGPDPVSVTWPTIPEGTPRAVVDLVLARPGWNPRGWWRRLQELAEACQSVNPTRAGELREAAELLGGQGLR